MTATALIIESLLRRKGGTEVPMPSGITYRFVPGHPLYPEQHTAAVSDTDDIAKFLAITEGYRMLGTAMAATAMGAAPVTAPATPVAVAPAITEPAVPATSTPPEAPTSSSIELNGGGNEVGGSPDGAGEGEGETTDTASAAQTDAPTGFEGMTRDEVAAIYEREVGRAPRANSKIDTMIGTIQAVREEKAAKVG